MTRWLIAIAFVLLAVRGDAMIRWLLAIAFVLLLSIDGWS